MENYTYIHELPIIKVVESRLHIYTTTPQKTESL